MTEPNYDGALEAEMDAMGKEAPLPNYPEYWRHSFTPDLVCPYCGFKDEGHELYENSRRNYGKTNCGLCEKEFEWEVDFSVSFTTNRLENKLNGK